jgi:AsmA protein
LQALALLAVDRVAITGGKLTYRDLSTPTPTEYMINDLEFLLQSVHMGETPSLHLVAMLQPFNLPLRLDGNFGPLVQTLDIKQFNFDLGAGKVAVNLKGSAVGGNLDATLSSPLINTSDLPVAVPLEKPVQVKNLHITAKAQYPLKQGAPPLELADVTHLGLAVVMGNSTINITGSVLGGHAKVSVSSAAVNTADLPVAVPLKKPVEIKELQVTMDLKDHDARVPNLSFQLFNGQAKAQAGMTMGANAPPFNGKVMIHGLQLGPALEAVGTDKVSVSGTADADLVLQGKGFTMPDLTNALEGTGHVAIREGKLEGLNLTQEILTALKAVGVSTDSAKATAFSAIEADLAIKQGIIHVQRLLMDSHDFQASGGGTVGFDQTLNLKLNLNLSQGLSQKLAGAIPGAKLVMAGGRLAVPLTVTGTAQAPSYGVDTKALGGRVQEQVKEKVKEAVGGLLKGSSKPEDLKKQGQELLKGLFGR